MNIRTVQGHRPAGAQQGFSLIELMVVVAIVSILAAIAYPSYQEQVRRSRRAEGKALLMEAQAKQERFFTANNSYASTMTALGYGNNNAPTENGWYTVAVSAVTPAGCASGTATPCTGFTLTATPQNDQLNDAQCAALSIDDLGQKTEGGTGTPQDCW
jgi:type IV pilus assembly protein PilE